MSENTVESYEIVLSSAEREKWLEARRLGIGGSDAPALLGLCGWASQLSIQVDKWGLDDEQQEAEHLRWGLRMEDVILRGLAEEAELEVESYGMLLRSTAYPWAQCTPDGVCTDGRFVQCKNTVLAREWQEGPPERVWVQVQHEMLVSGHRDCYVAALIMGRKLVWAIIERDDAFLESTLIPAEQEFWRRVQEHEPVEADENEATTRAITKLFPKVKREMVELDRSLLPLDEKRCELMSSRKAIESDLRLINNQIKLALGGAEVGVLDSGVEYTLKEQVRREYVVPEKRFRALRRRAAKGEGGD